jgi:hypothetical protein
MGCEINIGIAVSKSGSIAGKSPVRDEMSVENTTVVSRNPVRDDM